MNLCVSIISFCILLFALISLLQSVLLPCDLVLPTCLPFPILYRSHFTVTKFVYATVDWCVHVNMTFLALFRVKMTTQVSILLN